MYVEVRGERAEVRDGDNCTALEVRVVVAQRPQLDATLRAAGLGSWDGGEDAELTLAGLRAGASAGGTAGATGADWQQRWDAMVSYAASKGWVTADGSSVRAHLVELD